MSNRGFVIYMHVAEGHPSGLKIITKSNWSGVGLYVPRNRFNDNKSKAELQKPGIYILLGDIDLDPKIYIGEGDPLIDRLTSHQANKDFWDVLIAFTSKDASLNKAIIQHLESRLYNLASNTAHFKIENKNNPKAPTLSEIDLDGAEGYLVELLLCLPILGISLDVAATKEVSGENYFYINTSKGIKATGAQSDIEFTVFKGSQASIDETPSIPPALKAKRSHLLSKGILKDSGRGCYEFTSDYSFGSPSTAAGVIEGRSANGRTEWKDRDGITIKQREQKSLS